MPSSFRLWDTTVSTNPHSPLPHTVFGLMGGERYCSNNHIMLFTVIAIKLRGPQGNGGTWRGNWLSAVGLEDFSRADFIHIHRVCAFKVEPKFSMFRVDRNCTPKAFSAPLGDSLDTVLLKMCVLNYSIAHTCYYCNIVCTLHYKTCTSWTLKMM